MTSGEAVSAVIEREMAEEQIPLWEQPAEFGRRIGELLKILEANPNVETILSDTCRDTGFTYAQLRGKRRTAPHVKARDEVVRRLRFEARLSYPKIGALLNRDHSTIVVQVQRMERQGLYVDG